MPGQCRKNVVFFSNSFPNPIQPHRGVYSEQLVKALSRWVNPIAVCPLPWVPPVALLRRFKDYGLYSRIPREYDFQGNHVYSPKHVVIPRISWLTPCFMVLSSYPLLKRLSRSIRIDIINAHNVFPEGIAAARLGKILQVPVVLTALGSDINEVSNSVIRVRQTRKALQDAHRITAVSKQLCKGIEGLGIAGERITFIPNGVDGEMFFPRDRDACRQSLKLSSPQKMLLFVGAFREVKGVEYLLRAAATLKQQHKLDFNVVLIGGGLSEGTYQRMIDEMDLKDNVMMPGNRPHAEISVWLGAADLFCLPSLNEGMPNVILEALASGRPVVASRVGAIPDIVSSHNGVLVTPGEPDELSAALDLAIHREWDAEVIRSGVKDLTWDTVAMQYLDAYSV